MTRLIAEKTMQVSLTCFYAFSLYGKKMLIVKKKQLHKTALTWEENIEERKNVDIRESLEKRKVNVVKAKWIEWQSEKASEILEEHLSSSSAFSVFPSPSVPVSSVAVEIKYCSSFLTRAPLVSVKDTKTYTLTYMCS